MLFLSSFFILFHFNEHDFISLTISLYSTWMSLCGMCTLSFQYTRTSPSFLFYLWQLLLSCPLPFIFIDLYNVGAFPVSAFFLIPCLELLKPAFIIFQLLGIHFQFHLLSSDWFDLYAGVSMWCVWHSSHLIWLCLSPLFESFICFHFLNMTGSALPLRLWLQLLIKNISPSIFFFLF